MIDSHPRLILGTAQFGQRYGITNVGGQPAVQVLAEMLALAGKGLQWLDTSIKYGDALDRLGKAGTASFSIVTKIGGQTPESIDTEIKQTLKSLGRDKLDVVLFHDPRIFDNPTHAAASIEALQNHAARGTIGRIGASLYDAADVERALGLFTPDVLQLPASVADRRLLDQGVCAQLESLGVAVHYRSAFLQGLLLADTIALPNEFEDLTPLLRELDRLAQDFGTTRQVLCLAWVASLPAAEGVVCGVTGLGELDLLIKSFNLALLLGKQQEIAAAIGDVGIAENLLDPRLWLPR